MFFVVHFESVSSPLRPISSLVFIQKIFLVTVLPAHLFSQQASSSPLQFCNFTLQTRIQVASMLVVAGSTYSGTT